MNDEIRQKYYTISNRLEKCNHECNKCLDSNGMVIAPHEKYEQLNAERMRLSELCLSAYNDFTIAFPHPPFKFIMYYFGFIQDIVREPRVVYYGMHCVEGYLGEYMTEADFYSAIVYLVFVSKMTAPIMKPATEDDECDELCRKALTFALTLTDDEKEEYCRRHVNLANEAYMM